jgi:hypothetical protein
MKTNKVYHANETIITNITDYDEAKEAASRFAIRNFDGGIYCTLVNGRKRTDLESDGWKFDYVWN